MICKSKRSQAILDFILIFGVLIAFLVGLTRIWIWFNANYARRNIDYQATRLIAGKPYDLSAGLYFDRPIELDDDWVFGGRSGENIGLLPSDDEDDDEPEEDLCATARDSAADLRSQAHDINCQIRVLDEIDCGTLDDSDGCEADIADARAQLENQALSLFEQANSEERDACGSLQPYQEPADCP